MPGDVYSYGILLLEMFTGKRPIDEMFKDGLSIHQMAKQALEEEHVLMEIIDPELLKEEEFVSEISEEGVETSRIYKSLAKIMRIGVQCSSESPMERMDMRVVVQELQAIMEDYIKRVPVNN